MGKELSLARQEAERQPMLLARTSSGEAISAPSLGDQRTEEISAPEGDDGSKVEDIETKSKGSRKVEGANASAAKKTRRGRDNKNRKSNRGDEGKHKPAGRSAQKLGIVHPGSYCDEAETVPHYWSEVEKVASGAVFQCKLCYDYVWLPLTTYGARRLANLIAQYGKTDGYCRYLDKHREAKMLMAKLQDLRRLEKEVTDKRKFAKMADEILSDKEYDRKRRKHD